MALKLILLIFVLSNIYMVLSYNYELTLLAFLSGVTVDTLAFELLTLLGELALPAVEAGIIRLTQISSVYGCCCKSYMFYLLD